MLYNFGKLFFKFYQIESNTVADDIDRMLMAYAGRQQMQCKPAEVVDNSVSCVGAALKAYDNIRFSRKHIGDLALALVAPVGSDYSFNQSRSSPIF